MWLRALYYMGLTGLTRDEVAQYEQTIRSGKNVEKRRKIKIWGLLGLFLCALLAVAALKTLTMLETIYTISNLQAQNSDLDKVAAFKPEIVTRGEETDPAKVLRRVRERSQTIYLELKALRIKSIDYSTLAAQQRRLSSLQRELAKLSAEAALARRELGAES